MPAGITDTDGFAYVGKPAWHGLGVKVEGEAMTSKEAIEAGELDWKVDTKEIYTRDNDGNLVTVTGKKAIYRVDTEEVFNIMGSRYTPAQNTEVFKLFDTIIGEGDAVFHTVGSVNGGRRVWILAKFPSGTKLDNGDELDKYLLLHNSHDGSSALKMQYTPVRVVCYNTLTAALNDKNVEANEKFYFKHTSSIINKANEARSALQLSNVYFDRFMEQANDLAEKEFDKQDMVALAMAVYNVGDRKYEDLKGTQSASIDNMVTLFSNGIGNKGETAWDAYNEITEFSDHHRPIGRSLLTLGQHDEMTRDSRLEKTWFGDGQKLRDRAFTILSENNFRDILHPQPVKAEELPW